MPVKTRKILVVDDDHDILEALRVMLTMVGFDVETTPKGEETYHKIDSYQPDLILLDVLLSGKDGRHICQKLKQQMATKNIPIIMISAHPSAKRSAEKVGANDFLAKPFDMDEMIARIEKYI